jgi:hypothetical protein
MAELSLPQGVNFAQKLPHIPENTQQSLMTILPTNGNAFKAGSVVSFDLPTRPGLYLQGSTAFIRYRFRYTSGATAPILRGTSCLTPFFKLDEYVNSTPVNSVYNYNQVANMYVNTHLGSSEKFAVQSALYSELKASTDNELGVDSTTLIASQASLAGNCSFSFPLYCSALASADKFICTGLLGQWRVQFTLAQISDMVTAAANLTDYQIENIELCVSAVDMGVEVDRMVASMGEKLILKTTGWANAGQSIASGTSGVASLMFNHRYQSINNLYLLSSGTDVAKDVNGIFDSRDITSCNGNYSVTIGSSVYPQLPIQTSVNKTGVLHYLRQCTSSLIDWKFSMGINATEFSYYLGSANATPLAGNITPIAVTTAGAPSKFIVGIPVSKISPMPYANSSLLSGVSASSTPIIANINIGTPTGQIYNVFLIAEYDNLISIDPVTRSVQVIA